MTRKLANISRGQAFMAGMLVGLVFLFAPRSLTGRLQLAYAQVFRRPLEMGRTWTLAQTNAPAPGVTGRGEHQELLEAHRRLRNELANVQAQLQEVHRQYEQLAKVRLKPQWENVPLLPASVLTVPGEGQAELIIGRGQEAGVAVGQYVMSPADHCIIGTIASVSAGTARVRLLTHRDSRIPASIGKLGIRWFIEGRGENTGRVPLVSAEYQIKVGDPVYAERAPGLLDVATIAAQVTQCRRDPDSPVLWDITVRPVCDPAGLTEVAVVVPVAAP